MIPNSKYYSNWRELLNSSYTLFISQTVILYFFNHFPFIYTLHSPLYKPLIFSRHNIFLFSLSNQPLLMMMMIIIIIIITSHLKWLYKQWFLFIVCAYLLLVRLSFVWILFYSTSIIYVVAAETAVRKVFLFQVRFY